MCQWWGCTYSMGVYLYLMYKKKSVVIVVVYQLIVAGARRTKLKV